MQNYQTTSDNIVVSHNVQNTEAGNIDFGPLSAIVEMPGLFHQLMSLSKSEGFFILENGSRWTTPNIDMVSGWRDNGQLLITQNQALLSTHRFALVNVQLQKAVPITLQREPIPIPGKAFFITKLDHANDVISLNNTQEWVAHARDHGTLRKFYEHDRIIVGVNTSDTGDFEVNKRYILMDTASNIYVRANPILL
jgi:hypothetical protein